MRIHGLRSASWLAVAAGGLVVGLAMPAAAHEASHLINGNTIKNHTIAGVKLKANTVTGAQIKESTLATVPRATLATKLPPLVWHPLTLQNGWASAGSYFGTPSYAVSAQGIVYLKGAIGGGSSGSLAFTLPAGARPAGGVDLVAYGNAVSSVALWLGTDGGVYPQDDVDHAGSAGSFTGLSGLSFPTN
jgi:hypothetical protein